MKSDLFMEIEETPVTESEKHVKTKSGLMSQLEYSISKKIDLFNSSLPRYAVRSMFACLFLALGTAIAFYCHSYAGSNSRLGKNGLCVYV